jgi:hypothetical protein
VESGKYEELIVNPTVLTLVRQRGNIDGGGVEFLLIRYGSFWQTVAGQEWARFIRAKAFCQSSRAREGNSDGNCRDGTLKSRPWAEFV